MTLSSEITPLPTWRSQIDVCVEPDDLLETLTSVEACEAWSPVGFDVDGENSGRLRSGTKVDVSGAIVGRRVRFSVEIVRADRERLILRANGPVDVLADYAVQPADGGSRMEAAVSVDRGAGGSRLAARAISVMLGAGALQHALARIAREAERRHAPPPGIDAEPA
jgi:Polyketide cyclase / dehydrase and lipid transport